LTQPAHEIAILQLMSLQHRSSKYAYQTLVRQALHSNSTTREGNKDLEEDAYHIWAPFQDGNTSDVMY
jgi:hypothetical protein